MGTQNLADEAANLILDAWPQQVAGPIAREIHSVLTNSRRDILTVGAVLALYFSSNGIEALRIALNRAYGLKELRPWWLTRLESIGYVVVAAIAVLALAFLVVLGPFLWGTLTDYVPALLPYSGTVTVLRLVIATLLIIMALTIVHKWLPCGTRRLEDIMPGRADHGRAVAGLRARLRQLPRAGRPDLCDHLCRPRLVHDRAGVPLHHRRHVHLRRRIQRRPDAPPQDEGGTAEGGSGGGGGSLIAAEIGLVHQAVRSRLCQHRFFPPAGSLADNVLALGLQHVVEACAGPVRGALTSTAMLPGACWFFHILVCAIGILLPGEHLAHARVDAPVDHELVRRRRLLQVGEVRALDALLPHPHDSGRRR